MTTTIEKIPPIKIKSNIAKPSQKTGIKVKAADLDALRDALSRFKHWGEYDAGADAGYKNKSDKQIVEVTLTAKPVIQMPVWQGYSKASKDDKKAWDDMYAKLAKHEMNHHYLSLEVYAKFFMEIDVKNSEIEALNKKLEKESDEKKRDALMKKYTPMTVALMKTRLAQLSKDLQAAQDIYDTKSDHGKKEGVKL